MYFRRKTSAGRAYLQIVESRINTPKKMPFVSRYALKTFRILSDEIPLRGSDLRMPKSSTGGLPSRRGQTMPTPGTSSTEHSLARLRHTKPESRLAWQAINQGVRP
jgi:hypothetical protein